MTTRCMTGLVLVDQGLVVACAPMYWRWRARPFHALQREFAQARIQREAL